MSTTTLTHRIQDERLAAGLTLVISAIALAFANFAGNGENGGAVEYAVGLGVVALIAAFLYAGVLPGAANQARTAWILGALAVVTCLAFWSGLPFVFGVGAVYSGSRAGRAGPVVLGGLAIAAAFVGCVIG
jgi:hypothetical protein